MVDPPSSELPAWEPTCATETARKFALIEKRRVDRRLFVAALMLFIPWVCYCIASVFWWEPAQFRGYTNNGLRLRPNFHAAVMRMTGNVELPENATNISFYRCMRFSPDSDERLLFQTDDAGLRRFAEDFTGRPLDEWPPSLKGSSYTSRFVTPPVGEPPGRFPWNVDQITRGRYLSTRYRDGGRHMAADLDRHVVYIVR